MGESCISQVSSFTRSNGVVVLWTESERLQLDTCDDDLSEMIIPWWLWSCFSDLETQTPKQTHTYIYIIIHIYIYISMGVSNKNGATILFTPQIPVVSSPMSSLRQSQEGLIRSKHKSDKACGCRDLVKQNSRRYVVAKAPSRYKGVFSNPWRIRGAAIYDDMDPINIPPMLAYIPAPWILWVRETRADHQVRKQKSQKTCW